MHLEKKDNDDLEDTKDNGMIDEDFINNLDATDEDRQKIKKLLNMINKPNKKRYIMMFIRIFIINIITMLICYLLFSDTIVSKKDTAFIYLGEYVAISTALRLITRISKKVLSGMLINISLVGFTIAFTVYLSNRHIFIEFSSIGSITGLFVIQYFAFEILEFVVIRKKIKKIIR